MKKITSILKTWAMSLIALFTLTAITSCDEDMDEAMVLSGQWRGDFGMYYDYNYRGRIYTFDSYDTDIVFYPHHEYATYGTGYQKDYYDFGPYTYQYYQFRWEIRNGIVYLTYPGNHQLDTSIRDYHLTNRVFSGRFSNAHEEFRLYKVNDYYDWTPYVNTYGYEARLGWENYYNGYWAKQRPSDKDENTLGPVSVIEDNAESAEEGIVSVGNRFNR